MSTEQRPPRNPDPRGPRRSPALIAAGAAVVIAVVLIGVAVHGTQNTTPGSGTRALPAPSAGAASTGSVSVAGGLLVRDVTIAAAGGVSLPAIVRRPVASGTYPLIVMPASWGSTGAEYDYEAAVLARAGYETVAYAQRGFGDTVGRVDFAGTPTQADVSTVIDWAIHDGSADPDEIGSVGVSYGAAISLLAAERDPRIRVVVAMSGWANLYDTFAPGDTVETQALAELVESPKVSGRLDADVQKLDDDIAHGLTEDAREQLASMSTTRSATADVATLNQRKVAVMLASGYQDSILPPADLVPFFDQLTGPKRMQLAPGDHGGPEGSGLLGKDNAVWDEAALWFDHYLRGTSSAVTAQPAVQLQDAVTMTDHDYASVPAAGAGTVNVYLGSPGTTDALAESAPTRWATTLAAGTRSTADLPPSDLDFSPLITPARLLMFTVSKAAAASWSAPPVTTSTLVSGMITAHLTLSSTVAQPRLFGYLYDVAPNGIGELVTYAPYTAVSGAASPAPVTLVFQPISWTVAAGHHLELVVDTVDARYARNGGTGRTTLSSSATSPATLTIPVG